MHPSAAGAVFLTCRKNGETLFKFLRRYQWFPLTLHGFRRDVGFFTDHPTSIEPVIEDARQPVGCFFALPSRIDCHEGSPTAKPISPRMEFLADFRQRVLIGQQQIPGGAPHFELFRVRLNPAVITSGTGLVDLLRLLFTVEIPIRRFADKTASTEFGVQSTCHALTELNGLAPRQRKGQADQNPVIRVNRIEVGVIGKPHGDTQVVKRVNCHQRFSIIAPEPFSVFHRDVGETAPTRVL